MKLDKKRMFTVKEIKARINDISTEPDPENKLRLFHEGDVIAYSDDFSDEVIIGRIDKVITKPHRFYIVDDSMISSWRIIDVVKKRDRRKIKGLK